MQCIGGWECSGLLQSPVSSRSFSCAFKEKTHPECCMQEHCRQMSDVFLTSWIRITAGCSVICPYLQHKKRCVSVGWLVFFPCKMTCNGLGNVSAMLLCSVLLQWHQRAVRRKAVGVPCALEPNHIGHTRAAFSSLESDGQIYFLPSEAQPLGSVGSCWAHAEGTADVIKWSRSFSFALQKAIEI